MFERAIAVDWSGGKRDDRTNNGLAVAISGKGLKDVRIQFPEPRRPSNQVNWRRTQLTEWLGEQLEPDEPRTLVLLDFPFSFPYGTASAWNAGGSWHELVNFIADQYQQNAEKSARSSVELLNETLGKAFRFDGDRCDSTWYLENGVSYYRATELTVSQVLSEFYAGSGAQVALSAISGIYALSRLLERRQRGKAYFQVWPFETEGGTGSAHVVAETYPALFPKLEVDESEHRRDARRVAKAVQEAIVGGSLEEWFQVPRVPFGRYHGISFDEQVAQEGWIFGIFN